MTNRFWHIWTIPIILATISLGGLISALLGDEIWNTISWLTLSIPLLVIARSAIKPPKDVKKVVS